MKTFVSDISGNEFSISDQVSAKTMRKPLLNFIQKENSKFSASSKLAVSELNYFKEQYISKFLLKQVSELSELEKSVVKSINDNSILNATTQIDENTEENTFGQRIADKVAEFGGSWTFIIAFMSFLVLWILINVFILLNKGFDPYPFILLNLILSCIAALQAPVIMMSQNRQEEKDRDRAKNDYMINLKSELEIRLLHEKIDHLILHQEEMLIEMQKEQIETMNDILKSIKK